MFGCGGERAVGAREIIFQAGSGIAECRPVMIFVELEPPIGCWRVRYVWE